MKNKIIITKNGLENKKNFLSELYNWRYFLLHLIIKNFKNYHKQTVMGPFWTIINPIIFTGVFTIIFGKVANLSTDGTPQFLFYFSSVMLWNLFRTSITTNLDMFRSNLPIFKNSYFPRITVPLANLVECILIFSIQIMVFIFALLFYTFKFNFVLDVNLIEFVKLILLSLYIILLSLFFGILFACMNSKYRDIQFIVNYGMQFLFYGTPIVYSISIIPDYYEFLFLINPLVYPITLFKSIVIGSAEPELKYIYSSIIILIVLIPISLKFFNYVERKFDDYV